MYNEGNHHSAQVCKIETKHKMKRAIIKHRSMVTDLIVYYHVQVESLDTYSLGISLIRREIKVYIVANKAENQRNYHKYYIYYIIIIYTIRNQSRKTGL